MIGAGVAILRMVLNRPLLKARAEEVKMAAADQLSDAAMAMVKQALANSEAMVRQAMERAEGAEARAEHARAEAERSRQEATEARREASDARREAAEIGREFRHLASAILAPGASLEMLREMVAEPGATGTARAQPSQA